MKKDRNCENPVATVAKCPVAKHADPHKIGQAAFIIEPDSQCRIHFAVVIVVATGRYAGKDGNMVWISVVI